MPDIRILLLFDPEHQERLFPVCDLSEGRTFEDPLKLFSLPHYDLYNENEEGLYGIGGQINSDTLEKSYKWGIFPWYSYRDSEVPYWYCPRQRFVIFPDKIHVSHSLRNLLNKGKYHITFNRAFPEVIHNCRMVNGRDNSEGAWLGDEIERSFIELHGRGLAKSVELWEGEELVGGFYGFWHKGVFQGDSMFSLRPSASQIALILFCRQTRIEGDKIKFIDTQFENPTFSRLGGEFISYELYRKLMDDEDCD